MKKQAKKNAKVSLAQRRRADFKGEVKIAKYVISHYLRRSWDPNDPGHRYQVKRIRTISVGGQAQGQGQSMADASAQPRSSHAPSNQIPALSYSQTDQVRYAESLRLVRQQVEDARAKKQAGKNDGVVVTRCRFSMDHLHTSYADYATRVARFGGGPGQDARHSTVLSRSARVIQGIVRVRNSRRYLWGFGYLRQVSAYCV